MNRRQLLCGLAAVSPGLLAAGIPRTGTAQTWQRDPHPLLEVWQAWKVKHLAVSGRVVDGLQQGVSHSEGQGYAMLVAATLGDGDAFSAMHSWTDSHLGLRPDALLAWRWFPDTAVSVPDRNNASDGDLFYAWALLRASERFGNTAFRDQAAAIATDLAAGCIVPSPDAPGDALLLPAIQGFQTADGYVINPAYTMPLAMRELAAAFGQPALDDAASGGERLMDRLAKGGLVPDWTEVTPSGPRPMAGFSDNAGYEAMRVPLFLLWSGAMGHPAVAGFQRAYAAARQAGTNPPTVLDRATGAVLESSTHSGYKATPELLNCAITGRFGAAIPPFSIDQPYYPATLSLLALLAQIEVFPQCVPI